MADFMGCGYYRMALPLQEIQRSTPGTEVTLDTNLMAERQTPRDVVKSFMRSSPYITPEPATRVEKRMDVIIGQRLNLPGPSQVWQTVSRQAKRPKLVFEVDDDLFSIDPSNKHAHATFSDPDVQRRLIENARVADVITVSTFALAEVMRAVAPSVPVVPLPNCVPGRLISVGKNPALPDRDKIVVGWAGSDTHAMDWAVAERAVRQTLSRHPDSVELHIIGGHYMRDVARYTPWSPTVPRYLSTVDFDIGLAPLQPHVFNDSKSHIKALEYAALGIPVIASNTGPYVDFVQHGVTGYLVENHAEWLEALDHLTSSPAARERMGEAGRVLARQFTIETWAPRWLRAVS